MERSAKHEARRERLAAAILELASRDGVERVTLRAVAAEAGVSMGQVQHYFASTADMLLYAVEYAMQGMERRIHGRVAEADWSTFDDAERMLRSMLEEMLGLDPETRRLLRMSLALLSRTGPDPRIAEALTRDDAELMAFTIETVQWAQSLGRADSTLDPAREADILWALAGQLGAEVALDRRSGDAALTTLTYALDRLFTSGRQRGIQRADRLPASFLLLEYRVGELAPVRNVALRDAGLPRDALVAAITRAGETIFPNAETVLLPGDQVAILVTVESEPALRSVFGA